VGGPGVAKGYLNDPEKSAKSFIHNPLIEAAAADPVIYKTGDLGKWLDDGAVDFMGRIDQQVKIRGHRIELAEIESNIRDIPDILDCVTVVRDLEQGNKTIVAYYVSEKEIPIDILRGILKENLPDYMVPNVFVRLDALPLTPNEKVNKSALPEPQGLRPEMATEYVEPSNEIQHILVEVWQETLAVDKIGINDNFFDLGGDSIICLQVVGRLKKRGYDIRPRDIFENQTIEELAVIVEKASASKAEQGVVTGQAPLTPVQRWFFSQKINNPDWFNQAIVLRTKMNIDSTALKSALSAVQHHHDALRARFADDMQEFMPLIDDINFVEKVCTDKESLENEINSLQSSLDIKEGRVFGAGLFKGLLKGDYLCIFAHHLVVDAVSWRVIFDDLMNAYISFSKNEEPAFPEKTTSFKDWAIMLGDYASKNGFDEETAFWKNELSEECGKLIVDHALGSNDIKSIETVTLNLSEFLTGHLLKDAGNAFNTDVNDILMCALMKTLSSAMNSEKVMFTLEGHGRQEIIEGADVSRTAGWFTTLYPVVLTMPEGDTAKQIRYVKEKLRSIPEKGINFGIISYLKGLLPDVHAEVSMNYLGQMNAQGMTEAFEYVDDLNVYPSDPKNIRAHLIDITCKVESGVLLAAFMYSKNLFRQETIDSLAAAFMANLEAVITFCLEGNAGYTPSDFELSGMSQEQLDDLISDLGDI
jgi:non-ribosomal peptide synthase protein (TIGR01720 family)